MKAKDISGSVQVAKELIAKLDRSTLVRKFDVPGGPQAYALTYSLIDMEESFSKVVHEHFPKLFGENLKVEELEGVLFDIGEELRHILHHINETKFFEYLVEVRTSSGEF